MIVTAETVRAVVIAVALALVAHGMLGYAPFPYGDDFAYAPLSDLRADPTLFPRDDQLRLFANHATVYDWLYRVGQATFGVEPVFRAAVIALAIAVCLLLRSCLAHLRAPLGLLPLILGLSVIVPLDGLGRGDFGGVISIFFHHHNVALTLILGAVVATLAGRAAIAGLCLGLAAYAQPMTAVHGAVAVGLGTLLARPRDVLPLVVVSVVVAVPAAWMIFGNLPSATASLPDLDLIDEVYRFRAPHHYDPDWATVGIATLYLLAGFLGAALLDKVDRRAARFALGVTLVFLGLHAVTVVVYKLGIGEGPALFILDANRSSSLIFVLGVTFALVGIWHRKIDALSIVTALLLAAILVLNSTFLGLSILAVGAALLVLDRVSWGPPIGIVLAAVGAALFFPPKPLPPDVPDETLALMDQIRAETPDDALFVVPVQFQAFRHFAQRSVYVDFKMFSVAQPDQAALTRSRIIEVTDPEEEWLSLTGWPAAKRWDQDQQARIDCAAMVSILQDAEAEYYLRLVERDAPVGDCPGLPRAMASDRLVLYGPLSE